MEEVESVVLETDEWEPLEELHATASFAILRQSSFRGGQKTYGFKFQACSKSKSCLKKCSG